MNFFPLSLPEAAFFYMGLAIQTLTRSAFVVLPRIIVAVQIIRLLSHLPANPQRSHLWPVITYFLVSVGLMIIFWPETILFAGSTAASNAVTPAQVQSFAASQSGGPVVTAAQTGLVPAPLSGTSLTCARHVCALGG